MANHNLIPYTNNSSLYRFVFAFLLLARVVCVNAQCFEMNCQQFNDTQFGKSAFNDAVGFTGKSCGYINMEYTLTNGSSVLDTKAKCQLSVQADTDEVYDVAYKTYEIAADDVKIVYVEYAHSNRLQMYVGKDKYELNYIDGDCQNSIPHLVFAYSTTSKQEMLTLYATDTITLKGSAGNVAIMKGSQIIVVTKR